VADRNPGRPRSADADRRILEAAVRLLAQRGYQGLTVAAVADAAGVGKPTVYRRFPRKADLVAAVILASSPPGPASLPEDARAALLALLAGAAGALGGSGSLTVLGSLLAQQDRDPRLITIFRERVFEPRRRVVHAVLEGAVERGEVRADLDLEAVDAMLFGSLLARAMAGEPVTDAFVERVVELLWRSVAAPGRPDVHPLRRLRRGSATSAQGAAGRRKR
jgi:AcrR family transcriptional regulator